MPHPAFLLLVATLLPLVSFGLLLFAGRRLGSPVPGWLATTLVAASFLCSLLAMYRLVSRRQHGVPGPGGPDPGARTATRSAGRCGGCRFRRRPTPDSQPRRRSDAHDHAGGVAADHPGWLDLGIYVDSLTIAMFAMVTLVALLVHWFAIGYMRGDPRFARFFAYLGLFCFSMLGLVLGGTAAATVHLLGTRRPLLLPADRASGTRSPAPATPPSRRSSPTASATSGFLVGFGILFYYLGNASLPHLWLPSGGRGWATRRARPLADGTVFPAGAADADGHRPVLRRDRQERAVPAARLAAGRDGRPDAGLGADPRRHDGGGRRLPARAHLPDPHAGGEAVHRRHRR